MRTSIIFLFLALLTASSFAASHGDTLARHFGLSRRDSSGDCSASAIAAGGLCASTCPANEIPQLDGTCACPSSYHIVKHGASRKRICQPHCSKGYDLSADFTTCICGPTSFTSHDKTKCWSLCPHGTYPLASKKISTPGSCPACLTPGVATCVGKGPGFALTCKAEGNNQYYLDTTAKSCVLKQNCPLGTYADLSSQSCLSCLDDGASSCSGSGTGEANTCGNNEAGMPTYLDSNYMCVTACGPCFYETSTVLGGNVCAACGVNALSCTDANTATLCTSSTYLTADNICVTSCPSGSFPPGTASAPPKLRRRAPTFTGSPTTTTTTTSAASSTPTQNLICTPCGTGAATCNVYGALTCQHGYALDTSSSTCVLSCPVTTYFDTTGASTVCSPCGANAISCTDGNTATICTDSTYLTLDNTCVTTCPSGSFSQDTSNDGLAPSGRRRRQQPTQALVCTPCGVNQSTCDANGALTCFPGSILDPVALACVSECPVSTFASSGENAVCTPCGANALSCTDASTALLCSSTSFLWQYIFGTDCVTTCPDGLFSQDTTPANPSPAIEYKFCFYCDQGVSRCTGSGPGFDQQCSPSYNNAPQLYLDVSIEYCVTSSKCPPNTFASLNDGNPSCLSCGPVEVLTCTDASTALTCGENAEGESTYLTSDNQCAVYQCGGPGRKRACQF